MSDPSPPDPFAAFAEPKLDVLLAYKMRRARERWRRGQQVRFVACCVVGSALGGGTVAAFDLGFLAWGATVGMSLAGAALGALIGGLAGAMWETISPAALVDYGVPLAQANRWSALLFWVGLGGAAGSIFGGTVLAAYGAVLMGRDAGWGPLVPGTFLGATAGSLLMVGVWRIARWLLKGWPARKGELPSN